MESTLVCNQTSDKQNQMTQEQKSDLYNHRYNKLVYSNSNAMACSVQLIRHDAHFPINNHGNLGLSMMSMITYRIGQHEVLLPY